MGDVVPNGNVNAVVAGGRGVPFDEGVAGNEWSTGEDLGVAAQQRTELPGLPGVDPGDRGSSSFGDGGAGFFLGHVDLDPGLRAVVQVHGEEGEVVLVAALQRVLLHGLVRLVQAEAVERVSDDFPGTFRAVHFRVEVHLELGFFARAENEGIPPGELPLRFFGEEELLDRAEAVQRYVDYPPHVVQELLRSLQIGAGAGLRSDGFGQDAEVPLSVVVELYGEFDWCCIVSHIGWPQRRFGQWTARRGAEQLLQQPDRMPVLDTDNFAQATQLTGSEFTERATGNAHEQPRSV